MGEEKMDHQKGEKGRKREDGAESIESKSGSVGEWQTDYK